MEIVRGKSNRKGIEKKDCNNSKPKIVVSLGGTISCIYNFNSTRIPRLKGKEILERAGIDTDNIIIQNLVPIDSTELNTAGVNELACTIQELHATYPDYPIVILMGTDSINETGCKLNRLCANITSKVPIIITGSMDCFEDDNWDGTENLQLTLLAADTIDTGTMIAFNNKVIAVDDAVKISVNKYKAFESLEGGLIGFTNDDFGNFSQISSCSILNNDYIPILPENDVIGRIVVDQQLTPSVLKHAISFDCDAFIIEGAGDGNFPISEQRGLLDIINEDINSTGRLFVITSKVSLAQPSILYEGGRQLQEIGVMTGTGTYDAIVARILTIAALTDDKKNYRKQWQRILPGDSELINKVIKLVV